MKNKLVSMAITIGLFTTSVAIAEPPAIEVTLWITPDKTLPGLSVPLDLRVRNRARAVSLGPSVRVRATSPDGQSFFADWEGVDNGQLELGLTGEKDDDLFTLPANATVDLEVPALDFSRPSWALDSRILSQPGEWTLQVYLYTDDLTEPVAVSNPAKLTILMPSAATYPYGRRFAEENSGVSPTRYSLNSHNHPIVRISPRP